MKEYVKDSSKELPIKKRSKLRILIGKIVLRNLRYINWFVNTKLFAKSYSSQDLDFVVFEHSSTLIRPLKNLDLQLQYNKITNLKIAIKKLNNLLIKPNKKFSFWYLVGNPTKKRGFKKGMVLQSGKVISDYGGGMCQFTNLIYWMVLHSKLTVTERFRHSYDVFPDLNRKLPFGSGATISYNYIDLQFTNNTKELYQLKFWLTDNKLFGQIRSNVKPNFKYKIVEEDHKIIKESLGGYSRHNKIYREVYSNDKFITKEFITENHALMMYNPLLESNNKKAD